VKSLTFETKFLALALVLAIVALSTTLRGAFYSLHYFNIVGVWILIYMYCSLTSLPVVVKVRLRFVFG